MANPNWKPGESGNPNGRPKGSVNKRTEAIRQTFLDFVSNNSEHIQEMFDHLRREDPRAALQFLKDMSQFFIPKMTSTDITTGGTPFIINVPPPSDQDLLDQEAYKNRIEHKEPTDDNN